MAGPLVETKLFVPRMRPGAVARPRLSERLRRGSQETLTLISAPAGFGKTTVMAEWLSSAAARGRSVAWLSLDADDSQPPTFWTYVIAALAKATPGVGADALAHLALPQSQVQPVLAGILNELAAVPREIDLVLDDYHLVDGPDISAGMTYLLEHLPRNVHVVMSTRADPTLPLPRLRAGGHLLEIRAADLRFTPEEVASYFDGFTGLTLDAPDIVTLAGRTEGWIAALQLAALSMQGHDDPRSFIAGFAGDDRYILDYLVEEVLGRQPDPVRSFLLGTSILDRLSGPLCDAVTVQPGGRAMLEALERSNLFVVPLDERRDWYRYHHLFADVLATHLMYERPDDAPDLHRRASHWYELHGQTQSAVRHALRAGDVERAAGLIELAIPGLRRDRQDGVVRGWVDVIPDDVVRRRPVLAVAFIGALMSAGEYDDVDGQRLDDVEQWLDTDGKDDDSTDSDGTDGGGPATSAAPMITVDGGQLARLAGTIQMYRAALALSRGDVPGTVRHAQLARDRSADGDDLTRAGAAALSGLASWSIGDLEAAHEAFSAAVQGMQRAGHIADILGCSITLADIRLAQGRLDDASATYDRGLRLAAGHPGTVLPGTGDMHVGLSRVAFERDDIDAAAAHLLRNQELGERSGLPQNPYRWRVALAQVKEAQGDLPGALLLLEQAQAVYRGDFSPDVRPVAAVRARLLATHGHVDAARRWADEQGLSADDELSYLHEYEHVTLARVLLARHSVGGDGDSRRSAAALLQRLLPAAEAGGRIGSAIEVLVLQSLAHHTAGDTPGGLGPLERALELAEPAGYVRVFAGEGAPMALLLHAAGARLGDSAYVRRLVAACSDRAQHSAPSRRRQDEALAGGTASPLSARELDVLRLLSTDLDGPGIARHLVVSLNTVRTHTKNIYAKLGVNSRRAAVRRAQERGLLSRSVHP